MLELRLKANGGWIDVSFDGETVTMAAVGSPLQLLVKEPANTAQRQKRTDERGRYRRMAFDALREAGAGAELDDASVDWSYRAG